MLMQICSNEFRGKFSNPNMSNSPTDSCSLLKMKIIETELRHLMFYDHSLVWSVENQQQIDLVNHPIE